MNYQIEKGSGRAAYLQLYEKLAGDIVKGVYPCLSRMPSKRTIAEDSGLSVVTVIHALELLTDEGYLEARERSGHYVIYRAEDFQTSGINRGSAAVHGDRSEISRDNRTGQKYTEMASEGRSDERDPEEEQDKRQTEESIGADQDGRLISGEPVLRETRERPVGILAKTMRRVITVYREQLVEKSPNAGLTILREAIAAYLKRSRDIEVSWKQIVIGSGSEYLYSLVVQIAGRDCVYGIEDPSYAQIRNIYQASGAKVDPLPLTENGIDSKALQKTDAAVLHVTPYRSFPSMNTADENKLREYVQWAVQRDALIIEDDYASEFTAPGRARPTLFSMEPVYHIIYMNTFTKTIASSVRAGYMILPEQRTQEILDMISFRSCTVSSLLQYTIAEVLNNGSFERHLNRMRRMHRKEQV